MNVPRIRTTVAIQETNTFVSSLWVSFAFIGPVTLLNYIILKKIILKYK